MIKFIKKQAYNVLQKDPAAKNLFDAIISSPSIKAMCYHNMANRLYKNKHHIWARILAQRARKITGIRECSNEEEIGRASCRERV